MYFRVSPPFVRPVSSLPHRRPQRVARLDVAGVNHEPLEAGLVDERVELRLPNPLVAPAAKTPAPIPPISVGKSRQKRTSAQYPKHRVEKQPVVPRNPAPNAFAPGQQRRKNRPNPGTDVVAMIVFSHPPNR